MTDFDLMDVEAVVEQITNPGDNPEVTALRNRSMEAFRNTEGGNGARLASRFGQQLLCEADDSARKYFVTSENNLWVQDKHGAVNRMATSIINEMYDRAEALGARGDDDGEAETDNTRIARRLLEHARRSDTSYSRRSMPQIAVDDYNLRVIADEFFDKNSSLLSCGDEVIELLDEAPYINIRPRERSDRCVLNTGVNYDPKILKNPPELVTQFLERLMPEPDRPRLMFKLFGHAIKGGNPHRYFVILKGGTTSGKTQLMVAIQKALGAYAGASQATIFKASMDDKPRPDIIELYKKRFAFLAEASKSTWTLQGARIKQFTGGDVDSQRRMRSDKMIKERPQCMPIIYTNEMPKIVGLDQAMKRRVIVPTLDHTIPKDEENVTIRDRFINDPDVQRWLLAMMIQGYIESVRDGMEDVEAEFSLTTSEAITGMYHLGDFLDWMQGGDEPILVTVPEDQWNAYGGKKDLVTRDKLHDWYNFWVEKRGDRHDKLERLSYTDFNAQLRDNHGFVEVKSGPVRWAGWKLRSITFEEARPVLTGLN